MIALAAVSGFLAGNEVLSLLIFCVMFFAGGFNQPIMCGGEPRAMLRKDRGKADTPIYVIQICVPKHG